MKQKIKTWSIRIAAIGFLFAFTILVTVLNPGILYAKKTEIGDYTVYHSAEIKPEFELRLHSINKALKKSEIYDPSFMLKICLNDGSYYPELMEKLMGPAFGWGFHNIAVFRGTAEYQRNLVELHGYKWNLEQLFIHEFIHCFQSNYYGIFNSNPIAKHPNWKWEGYPEYAARKNPDQICLKANIGVLKEATKKDKNGWAIEFEDGTIAPRALYEYWLLVQYCLDIKEMTYSQLLNKEISKASVQTEMMEWYNKTD